MLSLHGQAAPPQSVVSPMMEVSVCNAVASLCVVG